jgi:ATP-binding cassette subfamily B protein
MKEKLMLLWNFMKGVRLAYVGALLSVGCAALFTFTVPMVLRYGIDAVIGKKEVLLPGFLEGIFSFLGGRSYLLQNIWVCSLLIIALTLGRGLFLFASGRWASVAAESTAKTMREQLYNHLQHLPYNYHVNAETGDLVQRCTSDVETVRRFMHIQFVEVGRALSMVAISLPLLFSINVTLTAISIPVICVLFTFSMLFFTKVRGAFTESDEAEGRLSTVLQENLTGVRVVRAFANQSYELAKFDQKNRAYRDLTYRLIKIIAAYWLVSESLAMSQIAVILITGSVFAVGGSLTIGELVVFMSITGMLLWPIRQMGRIIADMGKAFVSLGRIKEILDSPVESGLEDGLQPEIRGRIEFSHVNFSYGTERKILQDISFTAEAGETIAILGPTGSGKSSLLNLLPRLYDYDEGSIRIDGVELMHISKKWIRRNIGYVLQEPFLYAKTIKENISLAADGAGDEDIFEAARSAAVHDVIQEFENGYETLVGERGVTLSGGQKQRLAIARALIAEAPVLCFDDSLSAVDTETDRIIRNELLKRKHRATTFIISHRLTTLQGADRILVLDGGRIVQSGPHEKLIAEDGLYRRIWDIQNSLSEELEKELKNERLRRKRIQQAV